MVKQQSAISLTDGIIYHSRVGDGRFEVVTGINFINGMTRQLKVEGGITEAQMRRNELHTMLDEWLDEELGLTEE